MNNLLGNDLFHSLEAKSTPKGLTRYLHIIYVLIISLTASALVSSSFCTILFQDDSLDWSTVQKVLLLIGLFIFCVCCMYPPNSASADYVVCLLLGEAKEICEKFKMAMVVRGNLDVADRSMLSPKNDNILRYVALLIVTFGKGILTKDVYSLMLKLYPLLDF